jgi:hypothetical protein
MNKQEIEWRDVVGYEGFYEVSNTGLVRRKETGKLIWQGKNCGYCQVSLCKYGKQKSIKVHRIVAMAFIQNPNNLPFINHKDEAKDNNSVENLEWCTRSYNVNYGTANARRVLHTNYTEVSKKRAIMQSKEVKQYDMDGNVIAVWANAYIAEAHGYAQDVICKCCNGEKQSHQGFFWKYTDTIKQPYKEAKANG